MDQKNTAIIPPTFPKMDGILLKSLKDQAFKLSVRQVEQLIQAKAEYGNQVDSALLHLAGSKLTIMDAGQLQPHILQGLLDARKLEQLGFLMQDHQGDWRLTKAGEQLTQVVITLLYQKLAIAS